MTTTKKIEEMVRDELKDYVRAHNLDIPLNLATEEMRSTILEKVAALEAAAGSSTPNGASESTSPGGEGGGEGQGSTSGDSGSSSDDSGDSSDKGDEAKSSIDYATRSAQVFAIRFGKLSLEEVRAMPMSELFEFCRKLDDNLTNEERDALDAEEMTAFEDEDVVRWAEKMAEKESAPKRFVVERFSRYVVDGVINNLREGTLIRSEHYDVEEMRRQGVPLRDAREDEADADKGLGHRFT